MACGTEGKGPYQPSTPACEASEAQLVLPTSPASLSGGGEGCRAAKNSSSSSSLLEGSVEPKIGEEESGTGSGEGRDQTELGPAVPTPRATVPGYRDRRVQICRDIWTQTPRGRWTSPLVTRRIVDKDPPVKGQQESYSHNGTEFLASVLGCFHLSNQCPWDICLMSPQKSFPGP